MKGDRMRRLLVCFCSWRIRWIWNGADLIKEVKFEKLCVKLDHWCTVSIAVAYSFPPLTLPISRCQGFDIDGVGLRRIHM